MSNKINYDNLNYSISKIKRNNILNNKLDEYLKLLFLKDSIIKCIYNFSKMYGLYDILVYLVKDLINN